MANQNPQPEIYYTRHEMADASPQGTTNTQTVFTNQANNEEVRIYGIQIHIITTAGGTDVGVADNDMKLSIQIGNARIPSQEFDIGVIHQKDDKMLTFPTPILVLFQQPIAVTVKWTDDTNLTPATTVIVQLIAELSLQSTNGEYPHSSAPGGVA
jgi:hypothetical protein